MTSSSPSTATGSAENPPTDTFASLRIPGFKPYFGGYLLYFFGINVMAALRGWLVYDLTGHEWALGAIMGAYALPMLIFSPIGGVVSDRFDKRKVIIWSHSAIAAVNLVITILALTNVIEFWHLILLSAILGGILPFSIPSRMGLVAEIVPHESLMNAIALTTGAASVAQLAGPAFGGLMINTAGVGVGYGVLTAFLAFSVVSMAWVQNPNRSIAREAPMSEHLTEAYSYIRRSPLLVGLLGLAIVPWLFAFPYTTLFPAFAKKIWDAGATGYTLLLTFNAIGAIAGALFVAQLSSARNKQFLIAATFLVYGVMVFAFAITPWFVTALLLILGTGLTATISSTLVTTVMQTVVSDEMRGRVISVMSWSWALMMLAAFPVDTAAGALGMQPTVAVCAILANLSFAAIFFGMPVFRRLDVITQRVQERRASPAWQPSSVPETLPEPSLD